MLIKRRNIAAVVIIFLILGGVLAWHQYSKPPTPTDTPNTQSDNDSTGSPTTPQTTQIESSLGSLPATTIKFTGSIPNTPPSLEIYIAGNPDLLGTAQQLATTLGLGLVDGTTHIWRDASGTTSLSTQASTNTINYSLRGIPASIGINPNLAASTAQQFLTTLNYPTLTIDYPNTVFIPQGNEFSLNTRFNTAPQHASFVLFPLQHQLNDIPLYLDSQNDHTQRILVNSDNQVAQARISPLPQITSVGNIKLIKPEEALISIRNSNPPLTALHTNQSPLSVNAANLENINLENMELVYRLNTQTNQILPYYDFSGTAKMNLETVKIQVTTPAYEH